MMLEDLQLDLNPLKTKIVHFDKGFKFLGAIFLRDGIFLPFPQKRDKEHPPPKLPPALTLRRYLELKTKNDKHGGAENAEKARSKNSFKKIDCAPRNSANSAAPR